jgi:hypothetical protein
VDFGEEFSNEPESVLPNQWREAMKGSIGGIVLIVLGSLFLINNLGIARISIGEIIGKWWPAILIIVGISMLARRRKK